MYFVANMIISKCMQTSPFSDIKKEPSRLFSYIAFCCGKGLINVLGLIA